MIALAVTPACNAINPSLLGGSDAPDAPQDAAVDASLDMPEPGLILRYTFEDTGSTARDVSGRHKDAMVSDPGVWTDTGRLGRAINLKGSQYVSLPSGILEGVDDFTITTWVKMTTVNDWARIYDIGNGVEFTYLTLSGYEPPPPPPQTPPPPVYDGVHLSSFASVTNEHWFGTKTHFPTAVWKHVAVTGTGGDRRLYIDGFPAAARLGGPVVPPREMEPLSPNSWLGRSHFESLGDPRLNGVLDDFRIYNRVLTASEIEDLASPQHDYSYWRFDETSGTSAKDSSDNAVGGSLSAGLSWVTGRLGGAVKLPGAPPGATGPNISFATSPLAACTEFTVAVWVKLDALDSSRIFDFGTGTTSYIYLQASDGTGIHFGMAAPSKPAFDLVTSTQPLSVDGMWHHLAVTLLAGTATIYVDGMSMATKGGTTIKPTDLGATTQNWLGQSRGGDRYLSGALDELRIACRAFTPDEITNLSRP
jgi:uncharacterized Zn-binding protein involved in type VI secretion